MSVALVRVSVRLPRGGGKGGRGSEVRLAERERKREKEIRDECFMGLYHAAKKILLNLKVEFSHQSRQRDFIYLFFLLHFLPGFTKPGVIYRKSHTQTHV